MLLLLPVCLLVHKKSKVNKETLMSVNCFMDTHLFFNWMCENWYFISKYYSYENVSINSNSKSWSKDSYSSWFLFLFLTLILYYLLQELLELGEAVGTQSRGLTQEQISLLPVSKFKCGFFLRKKSRNER
jgi:hypothetical protein